MHHNKYELLRVREVADMLKVADRTLQTWRRRGMGPPYINATGGSVRYRRADVESWIERSVRSGRMI